MAGRARKTGQVPSLNLTFDSIAWSFGGLTEDRSTSPYAEVVVGHRPTKKWVLCFHEFPSRGSWHIVPDAGF